MGYAFSDQNTGGEYLRVQVDSGATSGTPVGAILAGQVAYWKDQTNALVTNDPRFCDLGPGASVNRVAGFFQLAPTVAPGITGSDGLPQLYMTDLVLRKLNFNVQATGTIVAGAVCLANSSANTANTVCAASTTTAPVSQVLGLFTTTVITNNLSPCDVYVGFSE